jgi:acetyl esterase/lipase
MKRDLMAPPVIPMMDIRHITRKWLDIPYAHQSPAQKLDIYLPETGEGPFPVIIAIHGGGFEIGDKGDIGQSSMLQGLDRGYAVVSINYRLSQESIFPAQIYDCKAAVRFTRAHAAQYHLDPTRVAAWGASAGGHLSALVGTSAGVAELEDLSMGYADSSSRVDVVVDWFGPAGNFLTMDAELEENGLRIPDQDHSDDDSPESHLLGHKITEVADLVALASPITYITRDVPYFLIQHGRIDPGVPVQQSMQLASAIERVAGKERVTLEILEGATHMDPAFETPENVNRVFRFLNDHLK